MKKTILSLVLVLGTAASVWSQPPASTPVAPSVSTRPSPPAANPFGLTQADMQELNNARQKALQGNPDLLKDAAQLHQKMRDFQHKLDQAILAADPNVAPVVARIEAGPGQRLPMRPPGSMPPHVVPAPSH